MWHGETPDNNIRCNNEYTPRCLFQKAWVNINRKPGEDVAGKLMRPPGEFITMSERNRKSPNLTLSMMS